MICSEAYIRKFWEEAFINVCGVKCILGVLEKRRSLVGVEGRCKF